MSTEWWGVVPVGNYWWCDEICSGEDELREEVGQEMGIGWRRVRKRTGGNVEKSRTLVKGAVLRDEVSKRRGV